MWNFVRDVLHGSSVYHVNIFFLHYKVMNLGNCMNDSSIIHQVTTSLVS